MSFVKRILSLILALVLVIGLLPVTARAGALDNGLVYEVCEDHVEITDYTGSVGEVVIPAEIEGKPVTVIGDCAFYLCSHLVKIDLPDTLICIGDSAFSECIQLTNLEIPDSVTYIGNGAFYDCTNLNRIEISEHVTEIGYGAFRRCIGLTGIYVDENNPNYSSDDRGVLFTKSKAGLIQAPGDLTYIYTIPDGVYNICDYAFEDCFILASITIPESVGVIGHKAFYRCHRLSSIYFSGDAPDLREEAFSDVTATAYYPVDNGTWTDEVMQDYGGNITWASYTSPDHVHRYTPSTTDPTCTHPGYTIHTCICGDKYITDYADPTGHDYTDGICNRCGESDSNSQNPSTPTDPGYGIFAPEDKLNRDNFFFVLWNYHGSPEPVSTENPFTDISESAYYYKAACWAVESGITDGISPTEFGPNIPISRAQAATFLWRAAGSPEPININPYTDVREGAFYYKAVIWASVIEQYMYPESPTEFGINSPFLYGDINWNYKRPTEASAVFTYRTYSDHVVITGYKLPSAEMFIPAEIDDLPVKGIGNGAFQGFTSLTGIELPDSVTSIGAEAFSGCSGLTDIEIPDSVTFIGAEAFSGCSGLTDISIPDGVTSIHAETFSDCSSLTSIEIPGSVTFIGAEAFSGCSALTDISIPDGVTSIHAETFSNCSSLTSIKIPDGVTDIGDSAFSGCSSLTGIVIPDGVSNLSSEVFAGCTSLTDVVIPDSVTSIDYAAFRYCTSLTGIDLPDSVHYIALAAFYQCSGLTEIVIPDGITSIDFETFGWCTNLTDVVIPDSVTFIDREAFCNCLSLNSVEIPNGVTFIGDGAFANCSALTEIEIPDSVTSIGYNAFGWCSSLTGIHVDENNPNYSSDARGVLFDKAKTLLIRVPGAIADPYQIPDSVITIYESAFAGCSGLTDMVIPDNVTEIHPFAFAGCTGLTDVVIPDSITSISYDTFIECSNLRNVGISDSVTSIGYGAFSECSSLTEIDIPGSVTSIDDYAFSNCSSLTNIYFHGDAPVFKNNTFYDVTAQACYPGDNATWTRKVMQDYGGHIIWMTYDHSHEYTASVTAATCTSGGHITHICACGHSYIAEYLDPLGHNYVYGVCSRCHAIDPDYEAPAENPFTDIPAGAFYEAPVLWAVENGITSGVTADSFNPGGSCLRAQVVTFLWRAEGQPEPAITTSRFTDVKPTDFFYKPVLWAVEQTITSGISATEFGSYSNCNRAAVVTFLWRAAGCPEPISTNNPFSDVKTTDFFYKPVLWAVENDITAGLTATTFGPTAECNRAQVVTFLYRAYN